LKPPKNLFEKINKLGNAEMDYPMTNSFQQKLSWEITKKISSFPNNFAKTNNGLVSLIQGNRYIHPRIPMVKLKIPGKSIFEI